MFVLLITRRNREFFYQELSAKTLKAAKDEAPHAFAKFLWDEFGGRLTDFQDALYEISDIKIIEGPVTRLKKDSKTVEKAYNKLYEKDKEQIQKQLDDEERRQYEYLREKYEMEKVNKEKEEEGKKKFGPAMFCDHPNENPYLCTCPDNCYCKQHTCKNKQI